jgi:hypothetical protein
MENTIMASRISEISGASDRADTSSAYGRSRLATDSECWDAGIETGIAVTRSSHAVGSRVHASTPDNGPTEPPSWEYESVGSLPEDSVHDTDSACQRQGEPDGDCNAATTTDAPDETEQDYDNR